MSRASGTLCHGCWCHGCAELREVVGALASPTFLRSRSARLLHQHAETLGNFGKERLLALVESLQKVRLAAVVLVEDQRVELEAVGARRVQQFQRDLPLGSLDHAVGNVGGAAALAVVAPALGQEEVGVEQRLEPAATHSQMHRHDAVLVLAQRPTSLSLNSRSHVPLLRDGGLVTQPVRPQIVRLDRFAQRAQLRGSLSLAGLANCGDAANRC